MSIMLMRYAIGIIAGFDIRRSGIPSAPLDMEYDNSSKEI